MLPFLLAGPLRFRKELRSKSLSIGVAGLGNASLVAAVNIIVGAGEYTMGVGLTALVLLVLIKEKVLVLSRFGPGSKRRRKGDSPDQQER